MQTNNTQALYKSLIKAILFTTGIIILLWFLVKIVSAILLLVFAIVLAIIINHPVTWLENKNIKRGWASLWVFGTLVIILTLIGWFIGPKINEQLSSLITNLPSYVANLSDKVSGWFSAYPEIQKEIKSSSDDASTWMPSLPNTIVQVGNFSLSLLGGLVILIVFFSMVVYAVTNPRPLVELYLSIFPPEKRDKAAKALSHTSVMLIGWIRANLIGGIIEAVIVTAFLSFMNVPGAFVWGALALVAELIPKIGFYLMSIPPVLVALTVSPATALWVIVFFLAMNEIMGDFVMPKLRSSTMKIHPVSTLFLLLAMGAAFGLIGALLATPMAAIIKAYYEAFYLSNFKDDNLMEQRIDDIIYKRK